MSKPWSDYVRTRACELLSDLFDGPSGTARLGRLIQGSESGRLVLLRSITGTRVEELEAEVQAAQLIAHPSLVKVLGFTHVQGRLHIASEFISGGSLLQVFEALQVQDTQLEVSVSLKIVHDALLAAMHARQLLKQHGEPLVPRTIFADTVWVAEYGETLLAEVGVSRVLHGPVRRSQTPLPGGGMSGDADVVAAGSLLRRLLADRQETLLVPQSLRRPVQTLLSRAEDVISGDHFESPEAMANSIAALPVGSMATEGEVGYALRTLLRTELTLQSAKLEAYAQGQATSEGEEPTRVFNVRDSRGDDATRVFDTSEIVRKNEQPTLPPPGRCPSVTLQANNGEATGGLTSSPPEDDATRLMFVRPEDRSSTPRPPPPSRMPPRVALPSAPPGRLQSDMTQIFMPVFGTDAASVQSRPVTHTNARGSAPVATVPLLRPGPVEGVEYDMAPAYLRAPSRRRRTDVWAGVSLILAVILVIVVLFSSLR